ncbi:hypothetical protein GCM10022225_24290 [Plantactinospora mayteni]|uniref:Uncharacterized protein n=1 Tax=Plantactinospora mayteni TaxID=566021 RepID=A0ABQ4EJD2_9ACTN|nr:hypothetical protein Pma05_14150 [Plantactinospora mayteni]
MGTEDTGYPILEATGFSDVATGLRWDVSTASWRVFDALTVDVGFVRNWLLSPDVGPAGTAGMTGGHRGSTRDVSPRRVL